MDFADSPEAAAFRAECRAWLAANATPRAPAAGADVTAILDPERDEDEGIDRAREWQARAAAAGWAAVTWPREYGGRDVSITQEIVFHQERARFDVPDHVFRIGTLLAGPTLIAHGTDAQKQRWLPPLLRGEEIWCQLFSEPAAGSDLASLHTSAIRDGDDWIVNGQKVWSSGAHHAQWGMLLARTDPDVPKHAGITYFVTRHDRTGHRGPAAAPDHGRRALQRGVPHRRAGPGLRSHRRRERRMERCADHAPQRARRDRTAGGRGNDREGTGTARPSRGSIRPPRHIGSVHPPADRRR